MNFGGQLSVCKIITPRHERYAEKHKQWKNGLFHLVFIMVAKTCFRRCDKNGSSRFARKG